MKLRSSGTFGRWAAAASVAAALGLLAPPALGGDEKPGPGPHDDRAHHDPEPPRLDRAIEVLRELHPEMADRLEALRASSPERLRELIPQRFPWLGHLIEMREKDPEMFQLRVRDMRLLRRSMMLAARLQQPPSAQHDAPDDPDALRTQLRELVAERFEVRQQIRQRELEALEARIAELRRELEDRRADRAELIDRYTRELVEKMPQWRERMQRWREWSGPPGPGRGRWDGDRGSGDRDRGPRDGRGSGDGGPRDTK